MWNRPLRWLRWVLLIPRLREQLRRLYVSTKTSPNLRDQWMATRKLRWLYEDAEGIPGSIAADFELDKKSLERCRREEVSSVE